MRFFSGFFRKPVGLKQVQQAYAEIDALALATGLVRQEDLLVIDVRNPDEFSGELGHFKGARY